MRDNDSYVDMAKFLEVLLKTRFADTGIAPQNVYYGDQENVPRTPTACVDPGGKVRVLDGAPRRTMTTMTNYVIVYHYELAALPLVREASDRTAEKIEAIIHEDPYMNESVVDSMVTAVESGYLSRRNVIYRASRLTVEARSVKQLPSTF